ncbi:MAG TPA: adenylosuccinate lyase [Saprospiraceae bacterium]|nr:adenylosuccinate lyase [Saprospiraceae bacterium]HMP24863.1 adenylosuccinate lyase [Saprospiraceae bacterium]
MLTAISPIDGRYRDKVQELSEFFTEFALIKYRVAVEVRYFVALARIPLPQLEGISDQQLDAVSALLEQFDLPQAEAIKAIEKITNHDVKAVEYFLKERFDELGLSAYKEFIHFGLTSQDINNTAIPLLLKDAIGRVYLPLLQRLIQTLDDRARAWTGIPMLAHTHGQPASPTTVGKEIKVFVQRLQVQLEQLNNIPDSAKFGGATGNMNAHYVTYPDFDWHRFAHDFLRNDLGLERSHPTTQIEHYDNLAALFQALGRINTILIDFCRDIWTYISMEYFKQKTVAHEVGSSAMPHKVNPIDFENAEGNLGLANALFAHLAEKLPVSRLQRDLTDSTVLRNVGVPVAHTVLAFKSMLKGMDKLVLNEHKLREDLEQNWLVIAEAIQSILRREGYPQPYEALKALTRGKSYVSQFDIHEFIDQLPVEAAVREELRQITPHNYIGRVE